MLIGRTRELFLVYYKMTPKRSLEICPKCGKLGVRKKRWVKSSYYPMYASESCILLEALQHKLSKDPTNATLRQQISGFGKYVTGDHYRSHSRYHLSGHDLKEDKEYLRKTKAYRVISSRYSYDYIGHYSHEQYKKQMEAFKQGKRKSRPNGRFWHMIRVKPSRDLRKGWWTLQSEQSQKGLER